MVESGNVSSLVDQPPDQVNLHSNLLKFLSSDTFTELEPVA